MAGPDGSLSTSTGLGLSDMGGALESQVRLFERIAQHPRYRHLAEEHNLPLLRELAQAARDQTTLRNFKTSSDGKLTWDLPTQPNQKGQAEYTTLARLRLSLLESLVGMVKKEPWKYWSSERVGDTPKTTLVVTPCSNGMYLVKRFDHNPDGTFACQATAYRDQNEWDRESPSKILGNDYNFNMPL